ncbi:MAG: PDZ domain-containing protein [Planctomycetes bacterium]|nr:PDZ domain-containing protein [Planctomycetota bacterium]
MKKRPVPRWTFPALLAGALALGLPPGTHSAGTPDPDRKLERLGRLHDLVQARFVDEASSDGLFEGAIQGMLSTLDPWCELVTQEESEPLEEGPGPRPSGGIGLELGLDRGFPVVVLPLEGGPAFRSGVEPGDRILEIDGRSTRGLGVRTAAGRLRGETGTSVTLKLVREGSLVAETLSVPRAVLDAGSVRCSRLLDEAPGIGYIRMAGFGKDAARELEAAARALLQRGMRGLLLDLRYNGGGLFDRALAVADCFLADGAIVTVRDRDGHEQVFEATQGDELPALPVCVLVNEGTASAAEMVAAALQEHGRATIIGTRTRGKGTLQTPIPIDEEGKAWLLLTTARLFTPRGRCVDRLTVERGPRREEGRVAEHWGIVPDVTVGLRREQVLGLLRLWGDWAEESKRPGPGKSLEGRVGAPIGDPVLERAVEYLQAKR